MSLSLSDTVMIAEHHNTQIANNFVTHYIRCL